LFFFSAVASVNSVLEQSIADALIAQEAEKYDFVSE
jgi:hypothetical protein